ncbi:4-oxalocrotonate tautomerase [Peptoniphilus sp. AGMB00490]|uniref:4-oxalocrotonate tautomerase n=1 Tax=Peptoniphilus faecalis TaxID=2731255 RepID=A0A848RJY4_9FIRM|nr:2-hydroxymuconate tautomerase [Peptoniphilus faecalis]NMW85739.1 4-oxalocrotonate tautomerase [Peptoniphilus faecalis]
MPFIRIQLMKGRTIEQKRELAKSIIDIIDKTKFAKKEDVHVIYEEMNDDNYYCD